MNPIRFPRLALHARAVLGAAAWLAAATVSAAPSTQLSLSGAIERPGVYGLADLQALPSVTQTVTFQSGSTPQTHTFTGTSLWGLLAGAGIQTDPTVRNDALNRVVVATGSDGYRTVFALGELDPGFGNRQSLVAYSEQVGGVDQPLAEDGFARTTSPGDIRGGRYVSNLTNIELQQTLSVVQGVGGGTATSFTVSGDVLQTMTFDLDDLEALALDLGRVEETMGGATYAGISLWSLLNGIVGLATDPTVHNDVLGMYVVATGSDGYKAAFSLGELNPSFGNQPDIIAFQFKDGDDWLDLDRNGFARLIVPNDGRGGRSVSNLISLEVFHAAAAVPEPQALALVVAGLLLLFMQRRRARSGWAGRRGGGSAEASAPRVAA